MGDTGVNMHALKVLWARLMLWLSGYCPRHLTCLSPDACGGNEHCYDCELEKAMRLQDLSTRPAQRIDRWRAIVIADEQRKRRIDIFV